VIIPVISGMAVYGYFQGHFFKKQLMTEKFEDVDIQSAMEPFLTAERDRYWLKLLKKNRDLENGLMKNVPGWKTGTWYGEPVYFTLGDKWWDPTTLEAYAHAPKRTRVKDMYWDYHDEYSGPQWWDKYIIKYVPKSMRDHIWGLN